MRRLFTISLALLAASAAWGAGTDVLSMPNFQKQYPAGTYDASGYSDNAKAFDFTYTGDSGAEYEFHDIICGNWGDSTFWALGWDYPNLAGWMTTTKSGGYIKSVEMDMNYVSSSICFYVSDKPITSDNKYDAHSVYLYKDDSTGKYPVWQADGHYTYMYLDAAQENFASMNIEWTEQAPALQCKTPTIDVPGEGSCYPGTMAAVNSQTEGGTIHVNLSVNGVAQDPLTYEGTEYSFALPGEVGDEVNIVAWVTKEGFSDSREDEITVKLYRQPASKPYMSGYVWQLAPGQSLELLSDTEGAKITYSYKIFSWDWADGENDSRAIVAENIEGDSPVTIVVPENAEGGMVMKLTAYATAEGYAKSADYTEYISIISDQLAAPQFSLSDDVEVREGTEVSITRPDNNADAIHYTVNGGEEQTSTDWSVNIVLNEPTTITAWVTGPEPFKASEKVTVSYTIEKIEANMSAITPATFVTSDEQYSDTGYNTYNGEFKDGAWTAYYTYKGGFYNQNGENYFYMDSPDWDQPYYLYNHEAPEAAQADDEHATLNRIKVNADIRQWTTVYIIFSADAPIEAITEEMRNYDYSGPRVRVGASDVADYKLNEWIDVQSILPGARYFAVYAFGQNCGPDRIVVDYDIPESLVSFGTAAAPALEQETAEVYPAQNLILTSATPEATIVYSYKIYDASWADGANDSRALTVDNAEVASPATIAIPEKAQLGWIMDLTAYAKAENYTDSEVMTRRFTVVADPLSGIEAIESDINDSTVIYDLNGVRVNSKNLAPGMYIRMNGQKAEKIIVRK